MRWRDEQDIERCECARRVPSQQETQARRRRQSDAPIPQQQSEPASPSPFLRPRSPAPAFSSLTPPPRLQKPLTPLPYESLAAFNRRVEIALRPSIDTAIRGAKATKKAAALAAKNAAKEHKKASQIDPSVAADAAVASGSGSGSAKGKGTATISPNDSVDPLVPKPKVRTGPTEFAPVSQRKDIKDIAMAPPSLKKARRGLEENGSTSLPLPSSRLPISQAQKLEMEREREKAIRVYRELKEKREREQREA